MIDPGQLRTRLETPDDQGGVVRDWSTFATAWAQVRPLAARRGVEADSDGASQRYRIVLRNSFSITLQHRFAEGARIYRIVTIRDSEDRRYLEIEAELWIG